MVLALQSTTLERNMNVEAGLKIMNGLRWHLVEDGFIWVEESTVENGYHLDMPKWYFLHKVFF